MPSFPPRDEAPPPALLAERALTFLPPEVLAPLLERVMARMERAHLRLFAGLARLERATVLVEPLDLPHRFLLDIGCPRPSVRLAPPAPPPAKAVLRGKLAALLDLLEGRSDGDTLFFRRDLTLTGDTATIVALRNTLDREEIRLTRDLTAPLGPFAPFARRCLGGVEGLLGRARDHAARERERLNAAARSSAGADAQVETTRLRAELEALKARLAKTELRVARKEKAA